MFRLFRSVFHLFKRSPNPAIQDANNPLDNPLDNPSPTMPPEASAEKPVTSNSPIHSPIEGRPIEEPSEGRIDEPSAGEATRLPISAPKENVLTHGPANRPSANRPNDAGRRASFENLKQVLNVLRAYTVTFGRPGTPLELRAVIGAIAANLTTVNLKNSQLEGFMDEAIAAFDSLGMESSLVDVTAQLLAEQVAVWLKEQETTVSNVVSAYLQQFAPEDVAWESGKILALMQTVIATLNDGSLSKSGGRSLINRVLANFSLDRALSRWVAPEWVALAQRVASYVDRGELQQEVQSVAWSYIQQFQAILSPQLLEQILETGPLNLSPAEVLSGDLNEFSQMLYYKFQLLEADPVVTKSHEEIAADVHSAIVEFKKNQPPAIDVTTGVMTGELEISSPFTGNRTGNV